MTSGALPETSGRRVLGLIVLAQFCCTSVWFAGNGAAAGLVAESGLSAGFVAHLTSAVQVGFIIGTAVFSLLRLPDRFRPSRIFFTCAVLAAGSNIAMRFSLQPASLLAGRIATGFFLAGIYPVGMKIAADHFPRRIGRALGVLVGALVAGTAFPYLLRAFPALLSWRAILHATSLLCLAGGAVMIALVGDAAAVEGPKTKREGSVCTAFRKPEFRAAALGYFGHMWEVYAFWAFVPALLQGYAEARDLPWNTPLLACAIVAVGAPACALAGYLSQRLPAMHIATVALGLSGLCCLLSPLLLLFAPPWAVLLFFLLWGAAAVADSPLFSSLVAQHAATGVKGTALSLVTCVGFAITIASIQLLQVLAARISPAMLALPLALGPLLGIAAILRLRRR